MKKILVIIILNLIFTGNNLFAEAILFNCKNNEAIEGRHMHNYFSFDFDKKKFLWLGKAWVKDKDNIINGETVQKENIELPFLKEDALYLYLGWNEIEQNQMPIIIYDRYKLNIEGMKVDGEFKQNFDLINENNTFAGIESTEYYSCNIINKSPLQ